MGCITVAYFKSTLIVANLCCLNFDFLSIFVLLLPRKCLTIKNVVMAYKISDECIACGTCIDECPVDAIAEGDIYTIDAELCTDCGSCVEVCPVEAISIDE
jgi:ferredoxin